VSKFRLSFLSGLIVLLCSGLYFGFQRTQAAGDSTLLDSKVAKNVINASEALNSFGQLPLSFEANRGQTDPRVRFVARGHGYGLFLTSSSAVIRLAVPGGQQSIDDTKRSIEADQVRSGAQETVTIKFKGSNPVDHPIGVDELPGKSNYFIGNQSNHWHTQVPLFSKVRYQNIYSGIDLVYYGDQKQLEYDFIVAPRASTQQIRMSFEGAEEIVVESTGDLLIKTASGVIRQHKPIATQEVNGSRREIEVSYVVKGNDVRLELGTYDRTRPLKIDPVLVYSSFLGGTDSDQGLGIAVDSQGSAYVTGSTLSTDFPLASALQNTKGTVTDAFVVKFNPAGTALVYATYLGANGSDTGNAIAVDSEGNAYVTGQTGSGSFPVTTGVFQDAKDGFLDGFVTKLNPTGSALLYSTFLGGDNSESGLAITVDSSNRAIAVGRTDSTRFRMAPFPNPRNGSPLYKSSDAATQWSPSAVGLTSSSVTCITQDPTTPATLYAGTTTGVFKSSNAGANWSLTGTVSPGTAPISTNAVVVDPSNANIIYASTSLGVFKSTNGGATYTQKNNGLPGGTVFTLAIDPHAPAIIYAGTGLGVFKSTDGADSWVGINNGTNNSRVNKLVIDPSQTPAQTIYAGMASRGMLKTTNAGSLWTQINVGLASFAQITSLDIDPLNPSTLYVGLFPGLPGFLFKTTNGGQSWTQSDNGLLSGQPPNFTINSIAIDPNNTSNVYAVSSGAGVYKIVDGGANWIQRISGFNNIVTNAIAVDRSNSANLFAATSIGNDAFAVRLNSTGNLDYLWNFGGNESDDARAVAVDASGNAFMAGVTSSKNLPVVNAFQSTNGGFTDGWVAKLNNTGSAFSFLTYLGGSNSESAQGIAVRGGSAYVAGLTSSQNFPLANPLKSTLAEVDIDAFVTKLSPSGNSLEFSTYLGGQFSDQASSIAVDATGNMLVAGVTGSSDFPILSAPQSTLGGGSDAFVTKLNPAGTAITYSTYLGGGFADIANGIAVDPLGNAYIVGTTSSANFPTANPLQPFRGATDVFVAKLGAAADLAVSINATPSPVTYGSNLTYTIDVTNVGEISAEHVTLSNTLVSGTGVVSINSSRGTCSGNRLITCDFGTLEAGAKATLTLVVLPPAVANMVDTAVAASTTPEVTNANNTATLNTPVIFTDLMAKNSSALQLTEIGGINTYIITVTNKGPAPAINVTVTDNLPPEMTFVSCTSTSAVFCGGAGNNRLVVVPSLAVGASFTTAIVARVNNSVAPGTVISNTASITSVLPDINPNNDAQTAKTTTRAANGPKENDLIAFSSDAGSGTSGTTDIYLTNSDGTGQTNITSDDVLDNRQPVWSPDGNRIAFIGTGTFGDTSGVWAMNADGTARTQVTTPRNSNNDQTPTWSPDGTRIAFGGTRSGSNFGVYVVNADGTHLQRLTFGNDPAWSPDGSRIAFGNGLGLGMMYADGSDVRTIPIQAPMEKSWSPDSSKLVLSLSEGTGFQSALYIVNADGTGLVRINTTDGGRFPSWSPDGSKIVFAVNSLSGSPPGCYTINIDGTGLTKISGNLPNIALPNWQRRQPNSQPLPPTITISGRITNAANGTGASAAVQVTGSQTRTTGTNSDGDYRVWDLPSGGNYIITPVLSGGTTSNPTNRVFNGPTSDQAGADFALTFPPRSPITGTVKDVNGVPLQNVRVGIRNSIPNSDTFTDSNGAFSFNNVFPGFQAFLICFNEGATANFFFDPIILTIQNPSGNNFIGRPKTASVSGTVTVGGTGKAGIQVFTANPQFLSTTTDANGNYSLNGIGEGLALTISLDTQTYPFTPTSRTLTANGQTTRVNFAAPLDQFLISGQVSSTSGPGIPGVTMTLSGAENAVTQTDNNGNYSFGVLPANVAYTVTASKAGYTFTAPVANVPNLTRNTQLGFTGFQNTLQFDSNSTNVTVDETGGKVTLTVQRSGFLTDTLRVDYRTVDGSAQQRSDYTNTQGTLVFDPQEFSKTIVVPLSDDSYVEGEELFTVTLSNAVGAFVGENGSASITIQDDDTAPPTINPLDSAGFYARQHYLDFLNRIPDASGLTFWTEQVSDCGIDNVCKEIRRINVSAAFFLSIEFQESGYLVERLYKVAYGDAIGTSNFGPTHQLPVPIIRFNEFLADSQTIGRNLVVGQAGWEQVLENNKSAFVTEFISRQRFLSAYPVSMTPDQFVDTLFAHSGVTPTASDRTLAISEFNGAVNTNDVSARARCLRRIAEHTTLKQQESNRAFVLMQYFGYLRRNPNDPQDTDYSGYDFWLTKLNQFNGNFVNADMVKAFTTSSEYRQRFGP
jgi:uncharacterized repeat protein (TIGR01451 family)